ncbi:hypothetical protein I4U23_002798 [Adineta vaga]|nr:hypothetical protein I4U23_002798 [Adineta vaga]
MDGKSKIPMNNLSESATDRQAPVVDQSKLLSKRRKQDDDDSTSSSDAPKSNFPISKASAPVHYQDMTFNEKNAIFCSFSSSEKKFSEPSTQLNPIQQLLKQVSTDSHSDDEDEQKRKLATAKKLLFPGALATSFNEVADTLRNERRQEFCPIYTDETPEQIALRHAKRKPVGSLLAKRIRWDDLKRKREEEERKAQMSYHYGPYGPIYDNQPSYTNPYEQYYTTMQNQYDMMVKMSHAQQEHSGFWPKYQQSPYQNNDQIVQNPTQYQAPPYTYSYSYPSMNSNTMSGSNRNLPSSWTSSDYYNLQLLSRMQPPPPPPPPPSDEP